MFLRSSRGYQNRKTLSSVTRASEWWEYKIAPICATFYATAFVSKLPLHEVWPLLATLLLALVPGAVYVSVINDVTDMRDDLASGKTNRLAGKPSWFVAAAIAASILPGVAFAILWRNDALLLGFYGAAWIAFSLYSIPPFRFKNRGFLGVLADAAGSSLFPHLVAALILGHHTTLLNTPPDYGWLACIGGWSLAYGLRGILWHQISDLENDEKVNVATFARMYPLSQLKKLAGLVIFPAELAFFAALLWRIGSPIIIGFLIFYVLLEWARTRLWGLKLTIIEPGGNSHVAMQECYDVFYPLALLLSCALAHRWDLLVLLGHVVLFPNRIKATLRDMRRLVSHTLRGTGLNPG